MNVHESNVHLKRGLTTQAALELEHWEHCLCTRSRGPTTQLPSVRVVCSNNFGAPHPQKNIYIYKCAGHHHVWAFKHMHCRCLNLHPHCQTSRLIVIVSISVCTLFSPKTILDYLMSSLVSSLHDVITGLISTWSHLYLMSSLVSSLPDVITGLIST